jgi:signal transduction histidine kinase/DNA-binding response OmpR family regulator
MTNQADAPAPAADADLPRVARPLQPLIDRVARSPVSVRVKLMAGFFSGALLLLGLGALSLLVIGRMTADVSEMARLQDRVELSHQLEYLVTAQSHYRAMALLTQDENNNANIQTAKQRFRQYLDAVEEVSGPATRDVLTHVREANDRHDAAGAAVLALHRAGQIDEAMQLHLRLEHPISHELEASMRRIQTDLGNALDYERADFADKRRLLTNTIVGFSGLSLGLALLLGLVFSWALIRPVRRIDAALADITSGAVGRQVEVPNRDELGTLAANLNQMSRELARLYGELRGLNASLEQKNEQLGLELAERRRAEAELAVARDEALEASRVKGAFLANMSHELRTPLNAIIGFSEVLQEDAEAAGQDALLPDLHSIRAAALHLLQIINDILDLSQIEAGIMDLQVEPINVGQVVEDVVAILRPLVQRGGNTLHVQCLQNVGMMDGDLTRVRQILFNLLNNACKFTQRGTIRLTVAREAADDGPWITFVVSDTGVGMTPEQLTGLFQSFGQIESAEPRGEKGTGLGLATSQRLCQLMGGEIAVASEYGTGSTFTVRLPARDSALEASAGAATAAGCSAATVLVIDHDPAVRERVQRLLTDDGLVVLGAASSAEGLRLARERRPGAITLDTLLPGDESWSTLAAIQTDPVLAGTPVILMTLHAETNTGYVLEAADQQTIALPPDEPPLAGPYVLSRMRELVLAAVGAPPDGALTTDAVPRPDPAAEAAALPTRVRSSSILIVDDNEVNRQVLGRQLAQLGHTTLDAAHGREALALLETTRVDLVLCDVLMPEMDGYEVLERRLVDPRLGAVPFIMVSPVADARNVARCIELGAEDYLTKPFDPVLLRARVSACLEKKQLRDQEVEYLRQVGRVTDAAAAVEAGTFETESLSDLARREDALGRLVRVFEHMVREVYAREQRLRQQVRELRIEIDQTKKARQVAEITDTDYFRQLQQRAQAMRRRAGAPAT